MSQDGGWQLQCFAEKWDKTREMATVSRKHRVGRARWVGVYVHPHTSALNMTLFEVQEEKVMD